MNLKFIVFLIWAGGAIACDQLIQDQINLLRQPRHPVKVNIFFTIYQAPIRTSYFGEVSEYQNSGLQSSKLWEESCTPENKNPRLVLNESILTFIKREEIYIFSIHCDGDFIIGTGKGEKMIATFGYEYNIHKENN